MNNIKGTYPLYVQRVFDFYKGYKTGQGLFLFRILLSKRIKYTAEEYKLMLLTILNLTSNGYLSIDKSGLVCITQDGYDYIQDEQMPYNKVNLQALIDLREDLQTQFDTLWQLIGKQGIALFYVSGPIFYNNIKPYLTFLHNDYADYMKELSDKGLSTSRIKWFRDLYCSLQLNEVQLFLHDLSVAIENNSVERGSDKEMDEKLIFDREITFNKEKNSDVVKQSPKKKVFISYCWETDIDSKHKDWVHKLAKNLEEYFSVIIDIEQPLGIELNQFMERTISKCDKVLIIATPEYKKRADARMSGVGYETSLITNDLVNDQNKIKFIPIIRKGSKEDSYPLYLGNRKGLNMTEDSQYENKLKELIENLQKY